MSAHERGTSPSTAHLPVRPTRRREADRGEAIAERRDFRLLHNHLTFDPVAEVLPVRTDAFWAALDKVRLELVTAAAGEGIDLIYTFVFAPGDEPHVDEIARA